MNFEDLYLQSKDFIPNNIQSRLDKTISRGNLLMKQILEKCHQSHYLLQISQFYASQKYDKVQDYLDIIEKAPKDPLRLYSPLEIQALSSLIAELISNLPLFASHVAGAHNEKLFDDELCQQIALTLVIFIFLNTRNNVFWFSFL